MNKKTDKKKWLKIPENLHWRLKEMAAKEQKFMDEFVEEELWKIAKGQLVTKGSHWDE